MDERFDSFLRGLERAEQFRRNNMPAYDYQCPECEDGVTIIRSLTDEEKVPVCVACNTDMLRNYSIQAIKFVGSGWASKEK